MRRFCLGETTPLSEDCLANGIVPVHHEHRVKNSRSITDDAQLRVAPGCEIRATIEMFEADVHPTRVSSAAIDHSNLAVIAIADGVKPMERRSGCRTNS